MHSKFYMKPLPQLCEKYALKLQKTDQIAYTGYFKVVKLWTAYYSFVFLSNSFINM